jgi:1-deoxy-D-xylulose-5-phosphate reductoisomerase
VGGTAPAVLNAANEIAVAAFLDEGLPYLKIAEVVERILNTVPSVSADSLEVILSADAQARQVTCDVIRKIQR